MLVKTALVALMGLAMAADAASVHHTPTINRLSRRQNRFGGGGKGTGGGNTGGGNANAGAGGNANAGNNNANTGNNNANAGSATCLAANALQTGSQSTGQNGAVAADGQVNSAVDNANFINVCAGKTLTNGLQNKAGSCNGIPMGDIPATSKMVSTVIRSPKTADEIPALTTFNVTVKIANMALGSFTNATSTYYAAPQALDAGGRIIGHTHITIQDTGATLDPTEPLDGTTFAFFKGINDAGDGQGTLTTAVTGGLPAGNYRCCSMAGSSNHQPVLMAVAQRGAQDDCKYFKVVAGGAGGGKGAGAGNAAGGGGTNNAAAGGATGGKGGKGGDASSSVASSSAAAAATSAAAGTGGGKGGKGTGGKGAGAGAGAGAASSAVSSSAAAATTSAAANAGTGAGGKGGKGTGGKGAGAGAGAGAASSAVSSSAAAATTSAAANAGTGAGGKGGKGTGGKGAGAAASTTSSAAAAATSAAASTGAGKATGGNKAGGAAAAGAIGGVAAPAVQNVGGARPFVVNGDSFVNESAAKQRACAIQNNGCANAVNSGKVAGKTVTDCNAQETACNAA